jgi:hypothetical protein
MTAWTAFDLSAIVDKAEPFKLTEVEIKEPERH